MGEEPNLIYWSVIEHHRWWLATDGPNFKEVQSTQKIDLTTATRLVREYSVARNIGKITGATSDGISGLQSLIDDINAITDEKWNENLHTRSKIVLEIADSFKKKRQAYSATQPEKNKKAKIHSPLSGITKLIWFKRPSGWTMFDQYARKGLLGNKNDFELFYETLDSHDFSNRAAMLTELAKNADIPLWGERIIDKMLMFRAMRDEPDDRRPNRFEEAKKVNGHYLALLPESLSKPLKNLADEVTRQLNENDFPCVTTSPVRRSRAGRRRPA